MSSGRKPTSSRRSHILTRNIYFNSHNEMKDTKTVGFLLNYDTILKVYTVLSYDMFTHTHTHTHAHAHNYVYNMSQQTVTCRKACHNSLPAEWPVRYIVPRRGIRYPNQDSSSVIWTVISGALALCEPARCNGNSLMNSTLHYVCEMCVWIKPL
jgi:hypothetical protein